MAIEKFLIGILVCSIVLIGISSFYTEINTNYNVNTTSDLGVLSRHTEINQTILDMNTKLNEKPTGISIVDSSIAIATGGWEALKVMLGLPNTVSNLLTDFMTILRIPAWAHGIIKLIATVVILFGIMKAIFKVDV